MAIEIPNRLEDLPVEELRWVGRHVRRREDPSLLTGRTEFIDDVVLPGMLHCAILRSPFPHARITGIDATQAEAAPGVTAVVTGADAQLWCNPARTAPEGWGTLCLATDKVRYVGEPVAAVAASSRYLAEDALELIEVDYEPLDPVVDPFAAMDPESPLVIEDKGTNVMLQRVFTWGEVDRALAEAAQVFTESFRWNRLGANPTETFGAVCAWDPLTLDLTVHGSIQSPSSFGLGRAADLGIPSNKVNVKSHPHGGSFGGKGGARGATIACLLSRKADGKPVKWIEDRTEYLTAGGSQAWDRHYEASLAVDEDARVTALAVTLVDDLGATGEGFGAISAAKPLAAFTGPYTIPVARYDLTLVATNKVPASPYRGMGPPPHFFVLEQMMDIAARGLAIDPAEFRRRNFIPPDQFPYTIPSGNEYDSGSYEEVLDSALDLAGYEELRKLQAEARTEGRIVGVGVASAIEPGVFDWNAYAIVGMPQTGVPEGATVSVDITGMITVRVGFALEGQGQYTLVSQLVADYFAVEMDAVRVVQLDTQSAPPSFGPGGSRLGVAISGAVLGACRRLAEKLAAVAAGLLRAEPDEIELRDGRFRVKGRPGSEMGVAQLAGTMLARSDLLPPDIDPRPEATHVWTAPGRTAADEEGRAKSYLTAAQAVHVVMVEIDPDTGFVEIVKYALADDCGTRLNPVVVEGQTEGSVAQGIGAALFEEYVYDDRAQPLTTTFMDYLTPTVNDVPALDKAVVVTPSPFTPLGAKGCGEGAIHTTPAAVMCAVNDALAPLGVMAREVPASPHRVWELLRRSEGPS
ncbi:MAG: Caffeine dehydrogenase subunit alpha [Acidimicrobiales bacterium]|nr:MAG: xanthine dehydrogenase family protein molybdopterin-binding subunit [Actinomycetota bacterium]MBV6510168.1 Caffeine dehydrogenase subunit alpha [Acidimicrobiales bacterium]RIK02364.1 MAG: carbon monoxide dehydrogenase [Acidobacteriota bacterium]